MGMWKLVGVTFVTVLVAGCVQSQTYCEDKPKILFYRKEQAALVSDGDSETNNHVVISNVNKEFLACVSTRNVEWVYEGHGVRLRNIRGTKCIFTWLSQHFYLL